MAKLYRSRTGETVEAHQFVCSPAVELDILAWANAYGVKIIVEHDGDELSHLCIPMTGGEQIAKSGDWIVRDGSGEFQSCWPDIFAARYEAVS
jgi:hypothetical protein